MNMFYKKLRLDLIKFCTNFIDKYKKEVLKLKKEK